GVFFHFGVRTFYDGHRDWDMTDMPANAFNPKNLNCDNWIKTIKEAGAKYAILVTKHHDGFANWPSKYTDYSVASTPWKDGKGDLVAEFTEACRKYDIKVGLYYSPADFGANNRTDAEHDDFFINQIGEILTNYGKIDYLWFDGCGSEGHEYNQKRIVHAIRSMQPEILIFNMWDPDTRWVGNECGIAAFDNRNTVQSVAFSILTDEKDALKEEKFLPAECDCMMRERQWFYSDSDVDTIKSVDELVGMYESSVGRGANLLLNIGPDCNGELPIPDATRLLEFGNEIKRRYESPLATMVDYEMEMEKHTLVNQVVLCEDLSNGEHIEEFEIWADIYLGKTAFLIYKGNTVGHKRICKFPVMKTNHINIKVTKASGDYAFNEGTAFYVK
ncbi:MAG: alpha-L-fucosidase, partial [Oscillospiraceae bacterium]